MLWDKALVTYDIEMNLPVSTRQAGIVQVVYFHMGLNTSIKHALCNYNHDI